MIQFHKIRSRFYVVVIKKINIFHNFHMILLYHTCTCVSAEIFRSVSTYTELRYEFMMIVLEVKCGPAPDLKFENALTIALQHYELLMYKV